MNVEFIEATLQAAVAEGRLGEEHPLAAFIDTQGLCATIRRLHEAFPDHFMHAFAAKANSLLGALTLVRERGMACEVASPGELKQALRAGFEADEIVYDEPAKTPGVLRRALALGVNVNIDNFQEFERIRAILGDGGSPAILGFRINPQVGQGTIGAMSTATATSKFGVALEDAGNRDRLLALYREHRWLTALHSHVGSQGCDLGLMAAGVRKVVDLAEQINAATGRRQVEVIDIGGGLPVNFESEEVRPGFAEYAAVLEREVPELFSGRYRVITEFGRSVFAKSGFIATRVEYTKSAGGRPIALTHAGAQVATRTVFMPEAWKLRLSVYDAGGRARRGETVAQDVAGPLCFAGDLLATARELPPIQAGDYVVLHDTGAYYFSNPFYYNAFPAPAVFAAERVEGGSVELRSWRREQPLDDMLAVIG